MSYQVLARKYRPQTFQEMMGQDHVLRALSNALDQQRLHHAYLFSGTRGVGKTTLARLLAKCLNCEQAISSKPCGECRSCQSITAGNCLDLIEVDAASRTKVEDTRELLDNVQYAPTQCRFKIYLIDEVHMLSNHSFNALLKTLEEPPEHVKFLLATTDPDKLPVTILSRCLQFNLQNMSVEQIQAQLNKILDLEDINYDTSATAQIAQSAQGSMRDALSLMDQAIAYCSGHLSDTDVQQMLGHISHTKMLELIDALAHQDGPKLIQFSQTLAQQGVNFTTVTEDLINTLHDIALCQQVPDAMLDAPQAAAYQNLAQHINAETLQLYYQIALLGRKDLALSPDPTRGFQMLLLRLLTFTPNKSKTSPRPSNPPQTKATPIPKAVTKAPKVSPSTPDVTSKATTSPTAMALPQSNAEWLEVVANSNLTGMCRTLASHCSFVSAEQQHLTLHLDPSQGPLLNTRTQSRLQSSLAKILQQPLTVDIHCSKVEQPTLAMHNHARSDAKQKLAEQALNQDPNVQAILQQFNAKLRKETIKPTA
jgi:DNA polymerase III subunit gamma/tau